MTDPSQKSKEITKLIELNDELENYFRNTVIPQLFVDSNYILRKFTPPAMKQFNLKPSDIGKHVNDLSDNIRFITLFENITEVIVSMKDFEKEIQTTDLRWFQMNILPYIIQKENKANGVIVTFIDITERINTLKEVEMLNADHENFIYSVSHDLKSPVINVQSLIQTFKEIEDKNSTESSSVVEMISTSIGNIKKIIDELGDLTTTRYNIATGGEKVRFENILEDVTLTLKAAIQKSGATIKTEFLASEINFSRKNIRSILYNILNNAIKYKSPERIPEIFVKTEEVKDYILLSIKDNGLGIAVDKLSMIFLEFSRISNSVDGSGIGLYIINKMVYGSGGKIEVESTLGHGTTFKIYFKILEAKQELSYKK